MIIVRSAIKVAAQRLKASKTLVNPTTFSYHPQMATADDDFVRHRDYYIPGGDVHFRVGVNTNDCRLILTNLDLDRSIEPVSGFTHS